MAKQKETKSTTLGNKKTLIILSLSILIIGLIILGLSSIGIFSIPSGGLLSNQCIPSSEYLCTNQTYNHFTGNIIVTLEQKTGTSWSTANFVFVPQGTAFSQGVPNISFTSNPANTIYGTIGKGLEVGQNISISLPVTGQINISTSATGAIWVEYTTATNKTPKYTQIALINIKAS
jgi:hypothetical protein